MMKREAHVCTECKKVKYHGCLCSIKGEQRMRWICLECQKEIEDRFKAKQAGEVSE